MGNNDKIKKTSCPACGSRVWNLFISYFDFSGDEIKTYQCINCGHFHSIKFLEVEIENS